MLDGMKRNPLFIVLLCAWAGAALAAPKVDELYRMHCAACHGANFEGGLGGSLVDGVWSHGDSDAEIARSIADGNPEFGMTPFRDVLSPDQVRAMVVFLREKEKQHRERTARPPLARPDAVVTTALHRYRMEVVADGLDVPWSIAFLPDGDFLVAERPGTLLRLSADGRKRTAIRGTPAVLHHGQGGLMEAALHPQFARNGWIYLAFTEGDRADGKTRAMTAIVRGRLRGDAWVDEEEIWRADRRFYGGSGVHFGSRIVFDEAGFLYFVIGERGGWHEAQDLARPNGKIYRVHDDGRVPADNPFVDTPGALPGIWTYGHRNPQGLAFDRRTGDLYSTEHGPRGGDEFNLIRRGANYGWPVISHGIHYNGTPFTALTEKEGMEQPVLHWTPSIAACGLAFYDGDAFPDWRGQFFAGALAQQEVRRLKVENRRVVEEEVILKNAGRVRDVRVGPDGLLYLALNEPHRIVRLRPAP